MEENKPRYQMIYDFLRKHILDGVYKEGSLLPSENELCSMHNITRPTVRRALDALVNDGYITRHQGKGSIVKTKERDIGILSISGTTSAVGSENLKTHIIVKPQITRWPDTFFYHIPDEIKPFGCITLERLRLVNDVPIFYDINYIPNINMNRFCSRTFEDKSLFDTLKKYYGLEIKGGEQRLKAIPADTKLSQSLRIKKGQPVLHLERKLTTNKQDFCIYSSLYCNTDNHSLHGYL